MRLNLLNRTVLMSTALQQVNLPQLNPRFGTVHPVNDKVFKFADMSDRLNAVLVERVDLGELFDKIPQDLTQFTFTETIEDHYMVQDLLGIDEFKQEYPVIASVVELQAFEDELGTFFLQWKRVIGLNSLERSEVELSSSGDHMTINARNAVLFKGTVDVKIK